MAEFLQLNQYQQRRLNKLNKVLLEEINIIDRGLLTEEYNTSLESLLSTDQYTKYYRNRDKFVIKAKD